MKLLRAVFCPLVMLLLANAVTGPAMADSDHTPPVHRVGSKVEHDVARFAVWYADPTQPWQKHFNRPEGWTVELLVVPFPTAPLEYQVDGAQMVDGTVPIYRFEGIRPFVPQPPTVLTPTLGRAHVKFGLPYLAVDMPMGALEGNAMGSQFELQLYALVPVDTTELEVVVRFDIRGRYRGSVQNGRLTFTETSLPIDGFPFGKPRTALLPLDRPAAASQGTPSPTTTSWGTIKSLYR